MPFFLFLAAVRLLSRRRVFAQIDEENLTFFGREPEVEKIHF